MKKIFFIVIIQLGCSFLVRASESAVGNGGDGVVCRDAHKKIISVQLLDFYEAKTQRGIQHDLGGTHLSPIDKVFVALDRLKRLSPLRAQIYREQAKKFFDETLMLSGVQLVDIPDSQHIQVPNGCTIEQLAIQREPQQPEDKRFTINADLWNLLDSDNKAGLILHEIIYREALSERQSNSISTRYFNSLYTSHKIDSLSLEEFISRLNKNNFNKTDIDGVWFSTYIISHDEQGKLKSAQPISGSIKVNGVVVPIRPYEPQKPDFCDIIFDKNYKIVEFYPNVSNVSIPYPDKNLEVSSYEKIDSSREPCSESHNIQIYPSGKIKRAYLVGTREFNVGKSLLKLGGPYWFGSTVSFYENDAISGGKLKEPAAIEVYDGRMIEIDANLFELDPKGKLLFGTLKAPTEFLVQGKKVLFGLKIRFNPSGYIWMARLAQSTHLQDSTGQLLQLPSNAKVEFDTQGFVVHYE